MTLWEPFQDSGGIAISWLLATMDGTESYTGNPELTPRALLFHTPTGHLGAVDPAQSRAEQSEQWRKLAEDSASCEVCSSIDWAAQFPSKNAVAPPVLAIGYFGFLDEVPAARDLQLELGDRPAG